MTFCRQGGDRNHHNKNTFAQFFLVGRVIWSPNSIIVFIHKVNRVRNYRSLVLLFLTQLLDVRKFPNSVHISTKRQVTGPLRVRLYVEPALTSTVRSVVFCFHAFHRQTHTSWLVDTAAYRTGQLFPLGTVVLYEISEFPT